MIKEVARVYRAIGTDSDWDTQYDLGSDYLITESLCYIHATDVQIKGKSQSEATSLVKQRVIQTTAGQVSVVLGIKFQPVVATCRNELTLWTVEGEPHEATVQIRITMQENATLTLRRYDYQNHPALQFCCKGGYIYYREVN